MSKDADVQEIQEQVSKERFVFGTGSGVQIQGKGFYPQGTYSKQEADAAMGLFKLSGRRDVHMFVLLEVSQLEVHSPDESNT
jgi:hypothetical protein